MKQRQDQQQRDHVDDDAARPVIPNNGIHAAEHEGGGIAQAGEFDAEQVAAPEKQQHSGGKEERRAQ